MKNFFLFLLALGFVGLGTGCDDEEPPEPPEELITKMTYELTPQGGGDVVTLTFSDLDGDGGNDPIIEGGMLMANTTYSGVIELFNEQELPAEPIHEEVAEEDEEHQFFFEAFSPLDLMVEYTDVDENNNPVGLKTNVIVGSPGQGDLRVVLRHEPAKDAMGVADGDITNAGGETDIEVLFPVTVQ